MILTLIVKMILIMKMILGMKIMKLMNMIKRPLSLIQGLIIMKPWMMTLWMLMPKRKIKLVKIPEISLKYRQMSQNISHMDRQRLNAQHRLIKKRIKSETKSCTKSHIKSNLKTSHIN